MTAGICCAYIITWPQTRIDGVRGGPVSAIDVGSTWRWTGSPVRIGDGKDPIVASGGRGFENLYRCVARSLRSLIGTSLPPTRLREGIDVNDVHVTNYMTLHDDRTVYIATLIEVAEMARPLLVFPEWLPPADIDLRVVEISPDAMDAVIAGEAAAAVDTGLRQAAI